MSQQEGHSGGVPSQGDLPGQPWQSAEFHQRLIAQAPVGMIAADEQLRIVTWNAEATRLLGRPGAEMVGRLLHEAVPEPRRRVFEKVLRRCMERRQTNQVDVHLDNVADRSRDVLILLTPLEGPDGGVVACLVDHTASTRMSERLAQAERMASLGTLAGGVAHHFNNILGGVATFVDYALTSGNVVAMKRALQMTAEAAARASRITQSLLSFAKHDQQAHDLSDLTEVILTFAHLVEEPLADKGIQFHLDLKPVPILEVESSRMHQVLGNLLTNAEEAMPQGGTITIGLEQCEHEICLRFADSGAGIAPRDVPLVFEPFFTTKGLLAGGNATNPGLGLSVVHGIVIDMGGHVEVESSPSHGSCFTIRLPLPAERIDD